MKGTVKIVHPKKAMEVAKTLIGDYEKEHCIGLYLNTKSKLTKAEIISMGGLDSSVLHPREVFKPAIINSACSVVVIHNHPSCDLNPSEDDMIIARQLVEAGAILGIKLNDFIIIDDGDEYWSFKAEGLI